MTIRVQDTAQIDPTVQLSPGCAVWDFVQIRENVSLGNNCIIGRGAYIGSGVTIGNNVKIQNNALIYEPATIADGVFIGPAVVLTNDHNPRSITPSGRLKTGSDWNATGVTINEGASIGANSVCIAPVTIGKWALVGAGSVVTKDVKDFALVVGNPARQIGWVGTTGTRLENKEIRSWYCPETGDHYIEENDTLRESSR